MLRDATTTVNFWSINQKELSAVVNGEEFNPAPKDAPDDVPALKVWPDEDLDDGKLWFPVGQIEHIEVLERQQ